MFDAPAGFGPELMHMGQDCLLRWEDPRQKQPGVRNVMSQEPACIQVVTYVGSLPAGCSTERLDKLGLASRLLSGAALQRRADPGAILRAAVHLQTLCLATRHGGGDGSEPPPPDRWLSSLGTSLLNATAAAQAAGRQLLLEQPDDQVGGSH
jgi:hypothetical protein